MDRLSHLRGEAGGSRDSTLDTTSPPSEAYTTANESSSKYFSLSEVDSVDSTFDISSVKDVSLASNTTDPEGTITNTDELISNLSPIGKKSDMLESYKIGKQIEAANILSGGVDIFDDNDNSYDGDELVIDDNVDVDDKSNSELKQPESLQFKSDDNIIESTLINEEADIASKDTEVVLQIDGKNVDAIDIGNGLYLYRKEGQEELAAVQIIDDDQQQTSFKFLKVRENAEGNLEVYEEIEIEVPKEVPTKEVRTTDKKISSHVPIKDINKVISESACNKVAERKNKIIPRREPITTTIEAEFDMNTETSLDGKSEVNFNGKMMKFSESRKSPVIGSFKPMTYHSTPNKEGIPLTKTMVDQQLHPNRHSDNVKKTIEVHTDSSKQKSAEILIKNKDSDDSKVNETTSIENESVVTESIDKDVETGKTTEIINVDIDKAKQLKSGNEVEIKDKCVTVNTSVLPSKDIASNDKCVIKNTPELPREQDNIIDSTDKDLNKEESTLKVDLQYNEAKKENVVDADENMEVDMEIDLNKEESTLIVDLQNNEEKKESVVDVKENMEVDMEIVETITDSIPDKDETNEKEAVKDHFINKAQKGDTNEKEPVKDDFKYKAQVNEVIDDCQINKDNNKYSQPVKVYEDKKETDQNRKNKAIEKDNTHSDSQGATKVEEIIYDITDQEDVEEIIIIDESEIDETKTDDKLAAKDNQDAKAENIKSQESVTVDANIANENTNIMEEKVDCSSKKETYNIEIDLTSNSPDPQEQDSKEEIQSEASSENIKNTQSKIPIPTSVTNKMITKPTTTQLATTSGELSAIVEPSKPFDVKQENKVLLNEPLEVKTTTTTNKVGKEYSLKQTTPDELQKISVKLDKTQPESKIEHKLAVNKTLSFISSIPTKTDKPKNENILKNEPKIAVQVTESQPTVASSAIVKAECSGKNAVTIEKVPIIIEEQRKLLPQELPQPKTELKLPVITQNNAKQETKVNIKDTDKDVKENKLKKEDEPQPSCSGTQDVSSTSTESHSQHNNETKPESEDNNSGDEEKPGTSKKAVPFGKWTATNRKEFLIKIKNRTTTPPATPSTSNQLKNSNDLNRRDVLQKIDSQRQSSSALAKTQEANKLSMKNETAFVSKTNIIHKDNHFQENKVPVNTDVVEEASTSAPEKDSTDRDSVKQDLTNNTQNEELPAVSVTSVKKDASKRTEVNYQELIDKTIEGIIHRTVVPLKAPQEEPDHNAVKDPNVTYPPNYEPTDQATLDAIEMKMNELHGIPFIERPPHELPVVPPEVKTYSKADIEKQLASNKTTKVPKLVPFPVKTQQNVIKENAMEEDSEEEIIEHEPITGDIVVNKKNVAAKLPPKEKLMTNTNTEKSYSDASKKESIITEKDFDKFARRNSITYDNCLSVNFDRKEPHNVIKTVFEKDPYPKSYSRNDIARVDPKNKVPYKYQNVRHSIQPAKVQTNNKFGSTTDDSSNRNQSKLQKAYQSALTAKRQMECPITIIEDKPVKVVFMDNMEYLPNQLNVQGQDLSPVKKPNIEPDNFTVSTLDSLESDLLDSVDDAKSQEEVKTKSKHQRKQVLTPVDEPELELIEPNDLGIEVSPKKKRKTEEDKVDKNAKYPMRKKYYLLGSNTVTEEKYPHSPEVTKNPLKETINRNDNGVAHKNAVSAIDNLVKAAELLEHQSENMNILNSPNPDSQQSTPVKRGRGRPRKYPLPEGATDTKVPSPQKKPRLIDAKVPKRDTTTDEDDESDDEIIKENWTMGKINENIVCPICKKLFRTENVVFKHVKHCTGPSPSRSDSDKRSPRRMRPSQESEESKSRGSKSDDMDIDDDKPLVVRKETPKKRKSKDSVGKSSDDKDDVIVIEDTPVKEKVEKEVDERKHHESRKPKAKILNKNDNLVCEFCGKSFRQLSYLVNHKLQHKKDEPKKVEKEAPIANKSLYSCEVCKKEFRKLHHLVQHRINHNPTSVPARSLRKSSSENSDKTEKEPGTSKQSEDASAGFRCEPCDKSFRKLHHLVEHRETHDGINRQKTTVPVVQNNVEKPISLHQCDVCKKTFRKLHHLIEHKEQHIETSSEKSDDKSVKSALSTRDIIHECSLCYMVFPNEHSLTKHTIICQRKKRQSKLAKTKDESEAVEFVDDGMECSKIEEKTDDVDSPKLVIEEVKVDEDKEMVVDNKELLSDKPKAPEEIPKAPEEKPKVIPVNEVEKEIDSSPQKTEANPVESQIVHAKRDFAEIKNDKKEENPLVPEKIKKVDVKDTIKVHETPKKKTVKEKPSPSASKRLKTQTVPEPIRPDVKPAETSDDDEVRYMLNPNFKVEDTVEEKVFMKVRANKRSSLQIERPNSKDLVKRRTSLQHPPKIPRLKPKAIEPSTVTVKHLAKPKMEPIISTDSDDSETIKYSFPKTIPEKSTKPQDRTPKDIERKTQKKLLSDKRKSLSGIAKRKSLGKVVTARHKPSPIKPIKRRTLGVEHRCDCGQLFSSAALLSRHTTLAHTPPRIRRRRSPPPEEKPIIKPAPRKSSLAEKPKQTPVSRKSSARSDSSTSTNTKLNKSEAKTTSKSIDKHTKTPADTKKPNRPEKSEEKSNVKPRRTGAHRGVPVPEKMRKLMQKNNK